MVSGISQVSELIHFSGLIWCKILIFFPRKWIPGCPDIWGDNDSQLRVQAELRDVVLRHCVGRLQLRPYVPFAFHFIRQKLLCIFQPRIYFHSISNDKKSGKCRWKIRFATERCMSRTSTLSNLSHARDLERRACFSSDVQSSISTPWIVNSGLRWFSAQGLNSIEFQQNVQQEFWQSFRMDTLWNLKLHWKVSWDSIQFTPRSSGAT